MRNCARLSRPNVMFCRLQFSHINIFAVPFRVCISVERQTNLHGGLETLENYARPGRLCVCGFFFHLPRKFLFNFILAEFFHHLHVLAEEHNVNGTGYAKYIRLVGPRTSFQHFRTRESISLDNLWLKFGIS